MRLGAGKRTRRIQFIERTPNPNPSGMGPEFTDTPGATYFATVIDLSLTERKMHKSLGTDATHKIAFLGSKTINYATTEFLVDEVLRLQPISPNKLDAPRSSQSVVVCRDVTKKR